MDEEVAVATAAAAALSVSDAPMAAMTGAEKGTGAGTVDGDGRDGKLRRVAGEGEESKL